MTRCFSITLVSIYYKCSHRRKLIAHLLGHGGQTKDNDGDENDGRLLRCYF